MRTRFRRVLTIVAITAIAIHTALWGGSATRAATSAVDPFSVICHSGETALDQAPAAPISAPSHACDHCNLCGSTIPPMATPAGVAVEVFLPRHSHVLELTPTSPHGGIEVALKGARGPPVFA